MYKNIKYNIKIDTSFMYRFLFLGCLEEKVDEAKHKE